MSKILIIPFYVSPQHCMSTVPNPWYLTIICCGLCFIICAVSFLIICRNLCSRQSSDGYKFNKSIKYYSILSISFYTITTISLTARFLLLPTDISVSQDPPLYRKYTATAIFVIMYYSSWYLGAFFQYLLWLSRLRTTYKESAYTVSTCKYIFLYCLLMVAFLSLLAVIGSSFWLYFQFLLFLKEYDAINELTEVQLYVTPTMQSVHFIASVSILYMFTSRLLKLYVYKKRNTMYRYDSIGNAHDEQILNTATKYCLLCVTAIVSTQMMLITRITYEQILIRNRTLVNNTNFIVIVIVSWISVGIDCVINNICIVLTLKFNEGMYLVLCKKCDGCCKCICRKCVNIKIERIEHRRNQTELMVSTSKKSKSYSVHLQQAEDSLNQ